MTIISRRNFLRGVAVAPLLAAPRAFALGQYQRIVSLDYAMASTLLSIGARPIGVASLADWGRWVVEPAMPGDVVDIGSSWEVNFELLAALKPDLVLTTPYLEALRPRLESFAPVLSIPVYTGDGKPLLPAAYTATETLGDHIGLGAEARAFLAEADRVFADCRSRLAGHDHSVVLVGIMDPRHARIFGAPGLYHSVLERIGVANAWTGTGNLWGFQTIGIEELAQFDHPDTRLFALEPMPRDVLAKLQSSPIWQALPAARPERFGILPGVLMFGMVREAMRFATLITDRLAPA
ncbi:iron-siderophore ABC transporter substrate-binding protein [Rhizobium sp.]